MTRANARGARRLVVVHHHYRVGGVRRVVDLTLPAWVRARPGLREVVLAGGEEAPVAWRRALARRLRPARLRFVVHPGLGYWQELDGAPGRRRDTVSQGVATLARHLGADTVVWAHNLSLGRSLPLAAALAEACDRAAARLVLHHHDWWFDNRWRRWTEMRSAGGTTVDAVAHRLLPTGRGVRHVALNHHDGRVLRRHLGPSAVVLANPAGSWTRPAPDRVRRTRGWLARTQGIDGPFWLLPSRLLRRKNVAEAILLTRWLAPEATLVTTGGVSSGEEAAYARQLGACVRQRRLPVRLGVLEGSESRAPSVAELYAASEVVLLTSLLEGFGLPYLEAVQAGRPLVARWLPAVGPDLARLGFEFRHLYSEVWVHPELFDWRRERERQERAFRRWRDLLPSECRRWAGTPWLLEQDQPCPMALSRLTLAAQLEVLSVPASESWLASWRFNPGLSSWRGGGWVPDRWPKSARLEVEAYAERLAGLAEDGVPGGSGPRAAAAAQQELLRTKLVRENLYPLLWSAIP